MSVLGHLKLLTKEMAARIMLLLFQWNTNQACFLYLQHSHATSKKSCVAAVEKTLGIHGTHWTYLLLHTPNTETAVRGEEYHPQVSFQDAGFWQLVQSMTITKLPSQFHPFTQPSLKKELTTQLLWKQASDRHREVAWIYPMFSTQLCTFSCAGLLALYSISEKLHLVPCQNNTYGEAVKYGFWCN